MSSVVKVRLGDYVTQIRGVSYKPKDISNTQTEKHTPILRAHNIQDEGLNFEELVYVDKTKINEQQYIRKGDILICASSGSKSLVGKAAQATQDLNLSFGAFCKVIRPRNIHASYLGYYFKSKKYRRIISDLSAGANINNLRADHIDNLEIVLPPKDIQEQIAITLDTTSELLALRKQQLAELDNLIKSIFYDLIGDPFRNSKGWDKYKLSDVAEVIMGQSPKGSSYNALGNGIPLLNGPTEFGNKYPIEKQWTDEPTKISKAGDILFCVRGATAGRMNISDKEYCIGRGLAAIRPKKDKMQSYIFLYLKMMYSYFQSTSNGSTFINISKEKIEKIPFLKVDNETLQAFSSFVYNAEEQKALVQQAIDETQHLFDSLMSEYFD